MARLEISVLRSFEPSMSMATAGHEKKIVTNFQPDSSAKPIKIERSELYPR